MTEAELRSFFKAYGDSFLGTESEVAEAKCCGEPSTMRPNQ